MSTFYNYTTFGVVLFVIFGYLYLPTNAISLDQFPNPTTENGINFCGRGKISFICDPNNFLNPSEADNIDKIILNATKSHLVWCPYSSHKREGEDDIIIKNDIKLARDKYDGLQIGIAIISSFNDYHYNRNRRSSSDISSLSSRYAKSIHTQWGIGKEDCNNAAMIFVTIYDRYLYISTGSAIKKIINDDFINNYLIPIRIKPLMKQQQYGNAIRIITESIIDILINSDNLMNDCEIWKQYNSFKNSNQIFGISYDTLFIAILILCGCAYLFYKYNSERDYRSAERHLAALYAAKQSKKFKQKTCPICLEEFTKPVSVSASDTQNNGNNGNNNRETALLVCGHKFCKSCLDSWFSSQTSSNQKCPICRHDKDDWSNANNNNTDQSDMKNDDDDEKKFYDNDTARANNDNNDNSNVYHPQDKTSSSDNFYEGTNVNSNDNDGLRSRSSNNNNNRYGNNMMDDWLFRQELLFRMRRVQYYYPRYVNNDMVNRWSRPGYSGSYTRDTSFRRANPNYRPPSSSSGSSSFGRSSSSGFSFGGGSSRGGGGGGGGW